MGIGSSASCVECMSEPFGLRMVMGCMTGLLLCTGRSTVKKVFVLPVSAMAVQYCDVGGPDV